MLYKIVFIFHFDIFFADIIIQKIMVICTKSSNTKIAGDKKEN